MRHAPRFNHDCDACVFLGGVDVPPCRLDVYICPQPQRYDSLVVRYGSGGSEYTSTPVPDGALATLTGKPEPETESDEARLGRALLALLGDADRVLYPLRTFGL